jgi:hypothetical protein
LRINFSSTGFSYIGEYTTYKDGLILYSNSFKSFTISDNLTLFAKDKSGSGTYLYLLNSSNGNAYEYLLQQTNASVMSHCNFIYLSTNKLVLTYSFDGDKSSSMIKARVLTVSDTGVSLGTEKTLTYSVSGASSNSYSSSAQTSILLGSKILIIMRSRFILSSSTAHAVYGMIDAPSTTIDTYNYIYETQIAKATTNEEIQGIALSSAIGGTLSGANAGHNQATNVTSITSP